LEALGVIPWSTAQPRNREAGGGGAAAPKARRSPLRLVREDVSVTDVIGRARECARIDELLDSARTGLGGALVVHGEAGAGKTTLLDYAVRRADDFRTIRLTGVESEQELGYSALQRLLAPTMEQVDLLPGPQREALNCALGFVPGPPASTFLVGLGVISLTANAASSDGPLLCVVDDAQWVDRESIEALAFWGRRLQADRIALIFGERRGTASNRLQGLTAIDVDGLEPEPARTLLVSHAGFRLDRGVADRILAETEGNPLAIVEVAKGLTPHALVGLAVESHPLPLTRRLEERFAGQVRSLGADAQLFLLLVAAENSSLSGAIWKAAARLGLGDEAAEAAEAADLISLGPPIEYRHPLIRSAVYGSAAAADRRAVHGALAAVMGPDDTERWAWHRAAAALGPDEEIAALLESCAHRALASGTTSAAVVLFGRAAELTPERQHAAQRRVAAAEVAVEGGSLGQAHVFVEVALPDLRDPVWRARAERADGLASFREGNHVAAAPCLHVAAVGLLAAEPRLGRQTLLEAVDAAAYCGDDAQSEFLRSIATTFASTAGGSSVVDAFLRAFSLHAQAGYTAALDEYQRAVEVCRHVTPEELAPWTNLIAAVTRFMWDDASHDLLLQRIADWGRARGALLPLWISLLYLSSSAVWRGQLEYSAALLAQAADVMSASGQFAPPGIGATLDAARGQGVEVFSLVNPTLDDANQRANGYAGRGALVDVYIGRANYREALDHALVLFDADPIIAGPHLLPDMVEAAVRTGDRHAAEQAISRLADRATAAATPWALGLLARSQAVMAPAATAEEHFTSSVELLGASAMELQLGRAHLLYGEWLRRARRHIDARDQLRRAHDMFAAMGAAGFVERARIELTAAGDHAPKPKDGAGRDLSPQEAQISELVAQGATNQEIASQLFISQRTVEYHLHKVFRKLGIKSRTQLARRVLEEGRPKTVGFSDGS
jgi:DNA-binding CsgD family transcriptional regulator